MRRTKNVSLWILTLAVVGLVALPLQAAPIEANFDAGETTTEVDGWTGMAGDGWEGPWTYGFQTGDGSTFTQRVTDDTPLQTGTGNYVEGTYTNLRSSSRTAYISRQFDMDTALGGGTLTSFQADFLLCLDSLSSTLEKTLESIYVSGNSDGTELLGTSDDVSWGFYTVNGSSPTFLFLDGAGTVDSGIVVDPGDVYQFSFTVDTDAQTYIASVSNLTDSESYTSEELEFRYKPGESDPVSDYLTFGLRLTKGSSTARSGVYSVDSVSITPEPATLVLLAGGFSGVLLRRRK